MKTGVLAAVAAVVLAGCGGGGGGGGGGTVNLAGGQGTAGAGGAGGEFAAYSAAGRDVTVRPSGSLPSPRAWSYSAPFLGANPRTVTGVLSLTASGGAILGDDGTSPATGLRVAAGAVLTLEPDTDTDGVAGLDHVYLDLSDGVLVEGTLKLGRANGGASAARWTASIGGSVAVRPGARVVATGDEGSASVDGGLGGSLLLRIAGGCSVEGTVDTRGGRGMNGGAGGRIDFQVGNGAVVVTGLATSDGGEGLAGMGGGAGGTEIWGRWADSGTGDFRLTGQMLARGGRGTLGGGEGAWSYGSSCLHGEAFSTGTIDTSGGDATVDGAGGVAGDQGIDASDARLLVAGRLLAKGGKGAGAGRGGDGNLIGIGSYLSGAVEGADISVHAVAEVDASGGAGASGGIGGTYEVWDSINASGTAGVYVSGAARYDLRGGEGTTMGGAGGIAQASSRRGNDATSTYRIGAVTVAASLDARGGRASAGAGGAGGAVSVYTYENVATTARDFPSLDRKLLLTEPVLVSGGAGAIGGGAGGHIRLAEHFTIDAAVSLEAAGGAGGSGVGGAGGTVEALCDGSTRLGAITADGGASSSAAGGTGGAVVVTATTGALVRSGTISVRGGAGPSAGLEGLVSVDGASQVLTGGQFKP